MFMVLAKKKNRVRSLNIGALFFVLLTLLSCTAATSNSGQPQSTQLRAENAMMKKRLPLMERENDVLNKENAQLRVKLQDLAAQNKQLVMDIDSLRQRYKGDMVVGEEQIRSLEDTLQKVEQENRATLDILLADNKVLEEKMLKQSRMHIAQLAQQKTASAQQREKLKKENSQKEGELTAQLAAANEKAAASELAAASLQAALSELSAKLAKTREASLAELAAIKAAGSKARSEHLAQLESIKTTNAELNQKIAELSRDLSRQKQPVPNIQ